MVGVAGEQVGIVRIEDALRLAVEADLDLVEVSPQSKPPVCKIMDFGKFKSCGFLAGTIFVPV